MSLGQIIYEPGSSITHAYFPTSSIVAPLYSVENGASVRLSIIGNEGLTGISSLLGGASTPAGVVVQSAGHGYRIKTNALKREFDSRKKLQHLGLCLKGSGIFRGLVRCSPDYITIIFNISIYRANTIIL